jgi:hypothetical protein
MEAGAAIQSVINILTLVAVQPYVQLVGRSLMTREEALDALKIDAKTYSEMRLPEPLVGELVSEAISEYADKLFGQTSPNPRPDLRII